MEKSSLFDRNDTESAKQLRIPKSMAKENKTTLDQLSCIDQCDQQVPQKFVIHDMKNSPAILAIGKRACGKSFLCADIVTQLYECGKINDCIIFSSTEPASKFYTNKFNTLKVYTSFTPDALEEILKFQLRRLQKAHEDKTKCNELFIIFDDCLYNKTELKSKVVQELLFNGRHYKIGFIWTVQFPLGISPELRCNLDYIFLAREDTISNKKRIYDHYCGIFPTFASFASAYSNICKDYKMLVIKNHGVSKSFFDKVMWYEVTQYGNANINIIGKEDIEENLIEKEIEPQVELQVELQGELQGELQCELKSKSDKISTIKNFIDNFDSQFKLVDKSQCNTDDMIENVLDDCKLLNNDNDSILSTSSTTSKSSTLSLTSSGLSVNIGQPLHSKYDVLHDVILCNSQIVGLLKNVTNYCSKKMQVLKDVADCNKKIVESLE